MTDSSEEFEIQFDEDAVELMDRLVQEGWFQSRSDFVAYSIQNREIHDIENLKVDPTLDQRIEEIDQIYNWIDEEPLQDFFLDTSYLMKKYSHIANDQNKEEIVEEVQDYINQTFRHAIANENISEQDVDYLLDRTVEMTDDFYNLSDETNGGFEGIIERYQEDYFEETELKQLLMNQ